MAQQNSDIKYLTPIAVDTKKKKYCRFKKSKIKYIDYKDPNFLLKFVNEQGKTSSQEGLPEHQQNTRKK